VLADDSPTLFARWGGHERLDSIRNRCWGWTQTGEQETSTSRSPSRSKRSFPIPRPTRSPSGSWIDNAISRMAKITSWPPPPSTPKSERTSREWRRSSILFLPLYSSRCNRGLRHYWGLRVRGQHTKTTGRS
jgi:hypothetical protein